jgi:hypothetical protein
MKRQETKRKRVFKWMAKIITTRTSIQIKAHHQKLERKHKNVQTIVKHLRGMHKIIEEDGKREEKAVIMEEMGVQCDLQEDYICKMDENYELQA